MTKWKCSHHCWCLFLGSRLDGVVCLHSGAGWQWKGCRRTMIPERPVLWWPEGRDLNPAAEQPNTHTHNMHKNTDLFQVVHFSFSYFVLTWSAGMYALMSKATMSGCSDSTKVRHVARSSSLYCLIRIHTCRESKFIKTNQHHPHCLDLENTNEWAKGLERTNFA